MSADRRDAFDAALIRFQSLFHSPLPFPFQFPDDFKRNGQLEAGEEKQCPAPSNETEQNQTERKDKKQK